MRYILIITSILLFSSMILAMGERPPTNVSETTTSTFVSLAMASYAAEVKDLKIEYDYSRSTGKQVKLTWTNPVDENFEGVKILVRSDRYPEHAHDYEGEGKLLVDLFGEPGQQMEYKHVLFWPERLKGKIVIKDPNQYYLLVAYDKSGKISKGTKGYIMGMIF